MKLWNSPGQRRGAQLVQNNYVEKSAVLVTAIFFMYTYETINIAEQIRAVTNIYIECNKYM